MKRRPWLKWIALAFLVEACLWLLGACRPCFDYRGSIDRTRPLLLARRDGDLSISTDGRMFRTFDKSNPTAEKLLDFVASRSKPHAYRTREGQLLDEHGRILLEKISDSEKFAYGPGRDLLVYSAASLEGVNIRVNGETRPVKTWSVYGFVQIQADGTIWITEDNPMHTGGIAALDSSGNFLGWRAKGYEFALMADAAADADDSIMPLVNKLLASKDRKAR